MKKPSDSNKSLREKAENALGKTEMSKLDKLSEADVLGMVHELRVHQVELELQNEELIHAHEVAQQSADRYTELYDFSPTGYYTVSPSGEIRELNLTGAILFGDTRSVIRGKQFENYLAQDSKGIFKKFLEAIKKSTSKQTCEVGVQHLKFVKTLYLAGVLDENKENYFISATDISELKNIQKELHVALDRAEESDKLKTSFLQNLGHEVRTPMNGIMGFSKQLLHEDLSIEDRKEYATIIVNSSNQLLTIINDVVSAALLETKQNTVHEIEFSVNDMLHELLLIFKPQAQTKNLSLTLNTDPAAQNTLVMTDKSKLYQVLSNLLANALKFTHEGGIDFGYSLTKSSLHFFVKDTGIGIDEAMQEKVFERFRQASSGTKIIYGGTGLGLSISKGLIELLGGEMWMESSLGKGSNFQFTLPLQITEKGKADMVIKGKPVILIVDDLLLNLKYLELIISKDLGYQIFKAKSGMEAIELVQEHPEINFVLMDINMPVMSGREAAARIKEFRADLFIMAQTGYDIDYERAHHPENSFDDYTTKPIDVDALIDQVKRLFGGLGK